MTGEEEDGGDAPTAASSSRVGSKVIVAEGPPTLSRKDTNGATGAASDATEKKEVEILVAEVENRLRQLVIRIIRPALTQTSDTAHKVETLNEEVGRHAAVLHMTEKVREEVTSVTELMSVVQREIHEHAEQFRTFEAQAVSDLSKLRSGQYDLKSQQEEQLVTLRRLEREVARAWEETSRLQTQHDEAMRKLNEQSNAHVRQTERERKELSLRIEDFVKRHEELSQELLSESSGKICKLKAEIDRTWNFVQPITDLQDDVGKSLQRIDELESMLKQDEETLGRFRLDINQVEANFDKKCVHFQEDLQVVSAKFSAHHANLLKDFRKNCFEELSHLREEHSKLQGQQVQVEESMGAMRDAVKTESKRVNALHKELAAELEDFQKKRKKERLSLDGELRELKQDLGQQDTVLASFRSSLEHVGKVLGLVLEGERIVSSLEAQDFMDRSSEHWLRAPGQSERKLLAPQGLEALHRVRPAAPRDEPVELDPRRPVLIKDQYLPGAVQHNGHVYDRKDLLLLFDKLVLKAQQGLAKGPLANGPQLGAVTFTAAQPSANGGLAVGQAAMSPSATSPGSLRKGPSHSDIPFGPSLSESRKGPAHSDIPFGPSLSESSAAAALQAALAKASRQRPGSQGQPQGTGSRGGVGGQLGETEAPVTKLASSMLPHGASVLRLPVINQDARSKAPATARVAPSSIGLLVKSAPPNSAR